LALQSFRQFLGENDMLAYLAMMAPRLLELKRVLKPTGSIYLHCDPTASHYLKMLMDAVFGPKNFVNEIVWKRHNARSTEGRWPRIHDTILMYSKSDEFVFHTTEALGDKAKIPHTLITGKDAQKYQTYELTAPGRTKDGQSGKPWRGFDPSSMGRHWANTPATMEEWDAAKLIHWPKDGGFPRRLAAEPFVAETRMVTVGDAWTDIDRINQTAKERLGYPTQKPLALLERIINASSNSGDLVLDPFCGCGTAVDAAQELGRRWIGIDITPLAINAIKGRLLGRYGESIKQQYKVVGEPTTVPDAKQLAEENPYHFQYWALGLVGARPAEEKKGADKGIDGHLFFHDEADTGKTKQIILSVKAGNIRPAYVSELRGVIEREKADIGVLITMEEPTKAMKTEAASADFYASPFGQYPRLQILTISDLLSGKGIDYPSAAQRIDKTFKRAPKAAEPDASQSLPLA
jgi:site-specific DNA-methyltransferase (adenine-specific)